MRSLKHPRKNSNSRVVSRKIVDGHSASTCAPAFDSASGCGLHCGFDSGFVPATNEQDLRAMLLQLNQHDTCKIPEETERHKDKRVRTDYDGDGDGGGDGANDELLLVDNDYKLADFLTSPATVEQRSNLTAKRCLAKNISKYKSKFFFLSSTQRYNLIVSCNIS